MAEIVPFSSLHVLLVEDSKADAELIMLLLSEHAGEPCDVRHVRTLAEAVATVNEQPYHVVLLDLSLPDTEGFSGLITLHNAVPELPIVVLTGLDDEATALAAVARGAQDYLLKDSANAGSIRRSMRYAIRRKQFESDIIRQANYDQLTGLTNRALYESRLDMALARARRSNYGVGVFFLDLDGFKGINDQYGHVAGDRVLQETANRIRSVLRAYDTASRFGGDEFALLVEGISKPRDCTAIAHKLLECFEVPIAIGRKPVAVGVSIGIATNLDEEKKQTFSTELLMTQADDAMYRAKCSPHSTYCFYTAEMQEETRQRLQLEAELRSAVHNSELTLCYQPRQSLADGSICGLEALVRWRHPERGLMLPNEFMAIAEEAGIGVQINAWVLAEVCRDLRRWRDMEFMPGPVSVNISVAQLDDPALVESVMVHLAEAALPPDVLALEIPEAAFSAMTPAREHTLERLRDMGITLCLDRFGTDSASLHTLRTALAHVLKLDACLVQPLAHREEDKPLISAIINIAHQLGLKVVATGVESVSQRTSLAECACDQIQGFVLSRPMPANFLEEWLKARHQSQARLLFSWRGLAPGMLRKTRLAGMNG